MFQKYLLLLFSVFMFSSIYCQEKADTLKTLTIPELACTLKYPDSLDVLKDEDMHKKMEETKEKYFKADSNVNLKTMKVLLALKTKNGGQFNVTLKYLHNTNPVNDADRKKIAERLTDFYSKYGLTDVNISTVKIDSMPFMSVLISVKPFDGSLTNYIEEYSCMSGHNALFIGIKYFKEEDKNIFYDILYSSAFN